jgi:hypothetical protein
LRVASSSLVRRSGSSLAALSRPVRVGQPGIRSANSLEGARDVRGHSELLRRGGFEAFDLIRDREQEAKALLTDVPGFVPYAAFRTDGGGTTMTVHNASVAVAPPTMTEGSTVLQF